MNPHHLISLARPHLLTLLGLFIFAASSALHAEEKEGPTPYEIGFAKAAVRALSADAGRLVDALDAAAEAKDRAQLEAVVRSLHAMGVDPRHTRTLVLGAQLSNGWTQFQEELGKGTFMLLEELFKSLTKPQAAAANRVSDAGAPVTLHALNVDHNVFREEKGMLIHLHFRIAGRQNERCLAVAHFYFDDGTALKDFDGRHTTENGCVSTSTPFTPGYSDSTYQDLTIFMPYSQLHMSKGSHSLRFETSFYSVAAGRFIGPTGKGRFTFSCN